MLGFRSSLMLDQVKKVIRNEVVCLEYRSCCGFEGSVKLKIDGISFPIWCYHQMEDEELNRELPKGKRLFKDLYLIYGEFQRVHCNSEKSTEIKSQTSSDGDDLSISGEVVGVSKVDEEEIWVVDCGIKVGVDSAELDLYMERRNWIQGTGMLSLNNI